MYPLYITRPAHLRNFLFGEKREILYLIDMWLILIKYDVYCREKANYCGFEEIYWQTEKSMSRFSTSCSRNLFGCNERDVSLLGSPQRVGRCWTLSLILIDLLRRPTPFAARMAPPSRRISAQSNAPRSDVMSRRGQRNNPPSPLPPRFLPPCNRPFDERRRACSNNLSLKNCSPEKKADRSGARTGVSPKRKSKKSPFRDIASWRRERKRYNSKRFPSEAWIISEKRNAQKLKLHVDITYIFSRFTQLKVPERFIGKWKSVITTLSSSVYEWILHFAWMGLSVYFKSATKVWLKVTIWQNARTVFKNVYFAASSR